LSFVLHKFHSNFIRVNRGIARNLLQGRKERVWGQKSPLGIQGQSPSKGLGALPQKPETHADYSTEQNT